MNEYPACHSFLWYLRGNKRLPNPDYYLGLLHPNIPYRETESVRVYFVDLDYINEVIPDEPDGFGD
jgi:hypothetical protein